MITKTCSKCKIEQEICNFSKLISAKDGLQYSCKNCQNDYDKTRINLPKVIKKHKVCSKCGVDRLSKFFGYEKRARDLLQSQCERCRKLYRKNNKDLIASKMFIFNLSPSGIYSKIKQGAKERNIDFNISKPDFIKWYINQTKVCVYCKRLESDIVKDYRGTYRRLSIDRKINNKGYKTNNIVLACLRCNTIKSNDISYEKMIKIGKILSKED